MVAGVVEAATILILAAGVVFFDALAVPRVRARFGFRSAAGTIVLLLAGAALFGALLGLTGAWIVSMVLAVMLAAALALISNVKRAVLGEPLVFSDFALIGAVFQHPQFYISALKLWQVVLLIGGCALLMALVAGFSTNSLADRAAGVFIFIVAGAGLTLALRHNFWTVLDRSADPDRDVREHGLVAATLTYWSRWRNQPHPNPCKLPAIASQSNQLVVIIQCESFTDPAELFADPELTLPGLARARSLAQRSGCLNVPGFGAYTMRTEYGVLFGRDEEELGLRRFDPFLTAQGEATWAMPNRLVRGNWTSIFVHPHDLRFYGRHDLMPEAGFDRLVGEGEFAPPQSGEGRYITDRAVYEKIVEIAGQESGATLVYAVTIENHGPWPPERGNDDAQNGAAYLRLLRRGDALLLHLLDRLPALGRPVTLCFFGDHRPSIPGISEPGGARHTPYVLIGFGPDGAALTPSAASEDLTPAQLHHAILGAIRSWG